MAISSKAVALAANTAASLTASVPDKLGRDRVGVARTIVVKAGATTVYLGGPDVTSANGFALAPGDSATFDLTGNDELFAVATAATSVRVMHLGI